MAERRRGLGRGIGALIPDSERQAKDRPIDVFFGGESASSPAESTPVPAKSATSAGKVDASEASASKPVASKDTASKETASKDTGNKTESSKAAAKKSKAAAKKSAAEAVSEEPTGDSNAEGLVAVPGTTYAELELDSIVPNQRQPRSVFDEDELEELAASIKQVGVLQPVIVRPLTEPIPDQPGVAYELIMGERRWRASQRAGEERIPAIVRRTSDEDLLRDALLENLHRAELNPLEEAAAYQQLLEDFNCTQDELAKRLARSRPQITNTLRLMKLPPLVQRRVAAHILSAGHARALLGLSDPAAMERLAQRIVAEGLSVRQVEEIVAMGEDPEQPVPQRRRPQRYTPELGELSGKLADRFETKVKVNMGLRKGSIKIDFASIEDLNRILGVMSPEINAVDIESAEENE
ncbi:ParB/RepB/Spo0J family partition protein [Ancrocorticia populi]|uniref:Chromosome partitioning protein ParB n=1 Tax=Ancrocorticia populi TaxID=2175228 RepID=A0A2V1KBS4_9ACTO|nr:ParB/RepB/Spo0J family partition protein [Ancrocorticia populi]PWF26869.1 chromosome partitioning protein ParB [Ancrocorticia populi]